jgi:hypothetical protein
MEWKGSKRGEERTKGEGSRESGGGRSMQRIQVEEDGGLVWRKIVLNPRCCTDFNRSQRMQLNIKKGEGGEDQ